MFFEFSKLANIIIFKFQASCCGSTGPVSYNLNNLLSGGGVTLDKSCCSYDIADTCTALNAHSQGCSEKLFNYINDNGKNVGIALLCVAGVELIGFIFACCLANEIRNIDRRSAY